MDFESSPSHYLHHVSQMAWLSLDYNHMFFSTTRLKRFMISRTSVWNRSRQGNPQPEETLEGTMWNPKAESLIQVETLSSFLHSVCCPSVFMFSPLHHRSSSDLCLAIFFFKVSKER